MRDGRRLRPAPVLSLRARTHRELRIRLALLLGDRPLSVLELLLDGLLLAGDRLLGRLDLLLDAPNTVLVGGEVGAAESRAEAVAAACVEIEPDRVERVVEAAGEVEGGQDDGHGGERELQPAGQRSGPIWNLYRFGCRLHGDLP